MDLRQAPGVIALQSSPSVDVWSGWGSAVLGTAVSVLVLALVGSSKSSGPRKPE
jgi:hypothetical protein